MRCCRAVGRQDLEAGHLVDLAMKQPEVFEQPENQLTECT